MLNDANAAGVVQFLSQSFAMKPRNHFVCRTVCALPALKVLRDRRGPAGKTWWTVADLGCGPGMDTSLSSVALFSDERLNIPKPASWIAGGDLDEAGIVDGCM
jgi:hypothetical protein